MLCPFAPPVAFRWMLLRVATQSLKPVKLFSQQLPTFLLFCDRWSVAQQCWIRLHSSSNIVGATHAHYAWFTKTYGLYPSHDALQVGTLWERRVAQWWPQATDVVLGLSTQCHNKITILKMTFEKCQCFEFKQIFAITIECLHSKSDRFVFAFSHIVIFILS